MKKIYLGFTDGQDIPPNYDKYIWADKGCLEGISYCKENQIEYEILQNNWKTDMDIDNTQNYLEELRKKSIAYCSRLLNTYHQKKYAEPQWNILLGGWTGLYLSSFYDKYLKLKQIEKMDIEAECVLYDVRENLSVYDYSAYAELLFSSGWFHLFQYSLLYRSMGHVGKLKCVRRQKPPVYRMEIRKHKNALKPVMLQTFLNIYKKVTGQKNAVTVKGSYLPAGFLFQIMKKSRFKTVNYFYDSQLHREIKVKSADNVWRNRAGEAPESGDEFEEIIYRNIKINIPVLYVEGFTELEKKAVQKYNYAFDSERIYFSCEQTESDELFKIYLMQMKARGAKLLCIQHGGDYGIEKNMISHHEYSVCDEFITWGWRSEGIYSCGFKPMPAAKLLNQMLHSQRAGRKGEYILYVSYTLPKNISRFRGSEVLYENDREEEIQFLQSLPEYMIENMVVRPYMCDYGWNTAENIRNRIPKVNIDQTMRYYDALKNAKLVVAFNWSTTVIEALFENIPVIVRRRDFGIEDFARDDFMEMKDAGMIVSSFDELGTALQEIYKDIGGWWNEPKRQRTVRKIKNKYLYFPKNALELWEKELIL